MRLLPLLASAASAFLVSSHASAQTVNHRYWEFEAPIHAFDRAGIDWQLGNQARNLGDVDHDGVDDLLISIPASHRGRRFGGAARVISLATGTELYTVLGELPDLYFSARIGSGGDLDGDGVQDWLASATQNRLFLHSGADGVRLRSWILPSQASDLAILGDVDGDGLHDLLVGMRAHTTTNGPSGSAQLLSGLDGSLIRDHIGEVSGAEFGRTVQPMGDIDGDGYADYAIAARRSSSASSGVVTVYSGASGHMLYQLEPTAVDARSFGTSMDLTDDLDGDGLRDLALVDPDGIFGRLGRLHLVSGASGTPLYTLDGSLAGQITRVAGDLGDLNGDGLGELLLLIRYNHRQGIEIRSGADGALLRRYHGPSNYEGFGSIMGVGDVNSDGVPDFAATNDSIDTVDILSSGYRTPLQVCAAEVNSRGLRASLEFSQSNSIRDNRLRFQVQSGARNRMGVLFYGPGRTRVPLGQGVLCVSGPLFRMQPFLLNNQGASSGFLDFADTGLANGEGTLLPGSTWVFQAWYRDGTEPGAFNLTDAVSVPLRP